jgi:hypothetical protein
MKKFLPVAALALFAFAPQAQASILDITLGTPGSTTAAGALTGNVDLSTLGGNLSLSNAMIVSPPTSTFGVFAAPHNGVGLFGNNYLSVFGANTSPNHSLTDGTATITLGSFQNTLGFTWGTVDPYNTLILKDAGHTFTFTGQDILNIIGGTPGVVETDVSFFDPFGPILTAELTSSQNSFEAADFTEAPLPGALTMFAAALFGFAFLARRKILSRI